MINQAVSKVTFEGKDDLKLPVAGATLGESIRIESVRAVPETDKGYIGKVVIGVYIPIKTKDGNIVHLKALSARRTILRNSRTKEVGIMKTMIEGADTTLDQGRVGEGQYQGRTFNDVYCDTAIIQIAEEKLKAQHPELFLSFEEAMKKRAQAEKVAEKANGPSSNKAAGQPSAEIK